MPRKFRMLALVLCGLIVAMFLGLAWTEPASAAYERCYGLVKKTKTDKEWNWVRTTMTVRTGDISTADAEAGYFIANVLWAYTAGISYLGDNDDQWIEAGFTRGWDTDSGTNDILTLYWAERHYIPADGRYVYAEHRITSPSIAGGDAVAVRLSHISGGQANANWGIYINSVRKGTSDLQAQDHVHLIACGLENTASSGQLGNSTNRVDNKNMLRSQDGGSTYNGWEGDGLSYDVDSSNEVHADWKDGYTGEWWWDWRNW